MANSNDASLLIEIGTEELPPMSLDELAIAFANRIAIELVDHGLIETPNYPGSPKTEVLPHYEYYCTPRRIAALIRDVKIRQSDRFEERRGPAVNVGLDADGQPTRALIGFAASCGVDVDDLEKIETEKGAWFVFRATRKGEPASKLVPGIVAEALHSLPIPKPMRWSDHNYTFVRPAHWLVMLHGADVVDGNIFGLRSGRASRGHRFHHPQSVDIVDADSWLDTLRSAKVLADPSERRERVCQQIDLVTPEPSGLPHASDALIGEIANLTEWPVAIACSFDAEFLEVPQEALVITMETNQKFVPMFYEGGNLSSHFIGVANIESKDPAEIRKGYERVIRPRFADAKFFFDEDKKQPLAAYQDALKSVTYQQSLGSVWDKSIRVAELARVIANRVGVDASLATRAAALSKCDLMTRMVGEFPELQGVMGRYYATASGENADVANALDEFYEPRKAGSPIASGKVAQVLCVAERLDTLAGIFAVGMKPSGNKDPFALRRAALGLARTLIEGGIDIDLSAAFREALELLPDSAFVTKGKPDAQSPGMTAEENKDARLVALNVDLDGFVLDRLRGYYADQAAAKGRSGVDEASAYEAVRGLAIYGKPLRSLVDFDARMHAVLEFARLPEARALAAANKRIGNILRQAGVDNAGAIDRARLEAGAETALADALASAETDSVPLIAERDYVGLLKRLAALREPVDRFFDDVMVMVDDAATKANRLALLARLRGLFLRVADISLLPSTQA
jgi:glycyl-tRNA synthetase beta chain